MCKWDNFFKCFKADKVKIKAGQHFKFVVDDGKLYLNSKRYVEVKDQLGNLNNVYDPRKIQQIKKKKKKPITTEKSNPIEAVLSPHAKEDITIWNAKLNQYISSVASAEVAPKSPKISP